MNVRTAMTRSICSDDTYGLIKKTSFPFGKGGETPGKQGLIR